MYRETTRLQLAFFLVNCAVSLRSRLGLPPPFPSPLHSSVELTGRPEADCREGTTWSIDNKYYQAEVLVEVKGGPAREDWEAIIVLCDLSGVSRVWPHTQSLIPYFTYTSTNVSLAKVSEECLLSVGGLWR